MRPINLSEEIKTKLFGEFLEKFKQKMEGDVFNLTETSITLKTDFNEIAKEKVTIMYTQEAFLRMQALVDFFDTEVAWYGLCERLEEKLFRVYDVKVCRQYVTGAKVDTEDEDALEFFSSLTDDEAEHMHFQAHSHVKMSTGASGVDLQNQEDVVKNMGKTGFYIFQIWNKNGDINTYLYDLDNNTFYDRKDVVIEVEDALGTISDFITSVADLVSEKKIYPYQWQNQTWSQDNKKKTKKQEKSKKETEPDYDLHGYYYDTYGRWDW